MVNVENPTEWTELPLIPIVGVVSDTEQQVMIVWDFVRMLCIDQTGIRWKTPSISWDGISDVTINGSFVHATVWDSPGGQYSTAEVDIKTGCVTGGKSSPDQLVLK